MSADSTWKRRAEEYKALAEAAEQSDREAHEALLHTAERLKAAEQERDDLKAKLARVEALRDEWAQHPGSIRAHCADDLTAALADDTATGGRRPTDDS